LRDEYQLTQRDDIAIPIDFGRPWWPGSVHAVSGMDEYTPEGRWNNAIQRRIVIRFTQDLPDAFHLHITGRAWSKAVGAPIEIRVANMQSQMVQLALFVNLLILKFPIIYVSWWWKMRPTPLDG
jgi:hypothetical protein